MPLTAPSLCDQNLFVWCDFKLIVTSQEEGEKRKDVDAVMVLARASGDEGVFSCSATNGCRGFRQMTRSSIQVPKMLLRQQNNALKGTVLKTPMVVA